ncbi:MAG TPA: serine hydrolase [Planctomycetaceae bacterium]|nr:serine hydrolase [Planctomycetaceae bacterium]
MKNVFPSFFCFLFAAIAFAAEERYPVKETLQPYVDQGHLAGVVTVVADKNEVIQLDAVGFADLEKRTPMGGDTVFWIASQTKPVTAVAVMMLVEEGKLDLDAPVVQYLPELAALNVIAEQDEKHTLLVPVETPVTLRHLLSHTSGMAWVPLLQQKHKIDILPLSEALTTCEMTPLKNQPGKEYLYSNMGVNVAATAVERVSGMPFETFLDKRLFEPLGMDDTTFWPSGDQLDRLAPVYRLDNDKTTLVSCEVVHLTYPLDRRSIRFPEAAGGLFSTPNNLVTFYQMLQGEGEFRGTRILKPESVKEIRKKQTGDLPNGYGLCVDAGGGVFGHGGACGTISKVDTNTGLVYLYFVQEAGLPQAGEAQNAFFRLVIPETR